MTGRKRREIDRKPGGDPGRASDAPGDSTVVFYGDPQLVGDAFALALNAMDTSAALLTVGDLAAKPTTPDN